MTKHVLTFTGQSGPEVKSALELCATEYVLPDANSIRAEFEDGNHSLAFARIVQAFGVAVQTTRRPVDRGGWEDWTGDFGATYYDVTPQLLPTTQNPDLAPEPIALRYEDGWIRDENDSASSLALSKLGLEGSANWAWKAVRVAWKAAKFGNEVYDVYQLTQLAWKAVKAVNRDIQANISVYEINQRAMLEFAAERAYRLSHDSDGKWHWYYHHVDDSNQRP